MFADRKYIAARGLQRNGEKYISIKDLIKGLKQAKEVGINLNSAGLIDYLEQFDQHAK